MNRTNQSKNISKASKNQRRFHHSKSTKQRTDYHTNCIQDDSGDETEEILSFEWSGVMAIYDLHGLNIEVKQADVDTNHLKTNAKGPRGRPLLQWDFIFSPFKFDSEIGLDQFNSDGLSLEEMQLLGIKASLIR